MELYQIVNAYYFLNMSNTIYEHIYEEVMPELKRIGKIEFRYLVIIVLYIKD